MFSGCCACGKVRSICALVQSTHGRQKERARDKTKATSGNNGLLSGTRIPYNVMGFVYSQTVTAHVFVAPQISESPQLCTHRHKRIAKLIRKRTESKCFIKEGSLSSKAH